MLSVLPEPSRTVVAVAALTGLRAGEISGLTWDAGVVRVLHSVWRGRIGEPKTQRSKAPVPLIPQLQSMLEGIGWRWGIQQLVQSSPMVPGRPSTSTLSIVTT
jgi:integrase